MSFDDLGNYLTNCVNRGLIPGCVCWVGTKKETLFFEKYGYAQSIPEKVSMHRDCIFDLASLTKPIATAVSIMLLHERGNIRLSDTIATLLPPLKGSAIESKSILQLLTHASGLPAWYPTYMLPADNRLKDIANMSKNMDKVVYSCLGYMLLGKIVEQVAHTSLDYFFKANITSKIGVHKLGFGSVKGELMVAATEKGNEHEKSMASQYGDVSNIDWRIDLIRGEVHDGNAYYAFNGIAGNAGLFSNTQDLATFARAYLEGQIISRKSTEMMITDHTGGEEKRGLGWKMDMYPGLLSSRSFGHTGFTGTMLVVDPQHELIIILLANAVHPSVKLNRMTPIRRETVRLITETLKAH
jgi:CubicO group peptidase (beta-lactamase class C family)